MTTYPEDVFFRNRAQNRWAVVLIVLGVLSLPMIFISGSGASASATCLVIGLFMAAFKNKPVLRFLPSHAEIKPTPFASTIFIKNSDIRGVERVGNRLHIDTTSASKPVVVALSLFNREDHLAITDRFESLIHQPASPRT
jgi:hypothetical protein